MVQTKIATEAELHRNRISDSPRELMYLARNAHDPVIYPKDEHLTNLPLESQMVEVKDARFAERPPSLDSEGFQIFEGRVPLMLGDDGYVINQRQYEDDIVGLIKELTQAVDIHVAPPVLRISKRQTGEYAHVLRPVGFIHSDYTPASGARLVHELFGDHPRLQSNRIAIFNIWRSISRPPQDFPLAICDFNSVSADDIVCGKNVMMDEDGRKTEYELSLLKYNPTHRWNYYSSMNTDEAIVFKGYDSQEDAPSVIMHGSFDLADEAKECVARISVDVRAIAILPDAR